MTRYERLSNVYQLQTKSETLNNAMLEFSQRSQVSLHAEGLSCESLPCNEVKRLHCTYKIRNSNPTLFNGICELY